MPLAATFQPAASSAARALAGSTRPGSDGFHAAVVSPCFPDFFTDSTSSQNSLCFAPLSSITTPCFPADTTLPERPPQDGRVLSRQIFPNDLKVIDRDVRELRAPGSFPDSPDAGGARLQPVVDPDIAALVQIDAG